MVPADDETDLISKARSGDRGAFGRLQQKYKSLVASVVRAEMGAHLRGKVGVADLAQETFLKALESMERFRGEDERAFQGWLVTIARRVVQGQGRRLAAYQGAQRREVSLEQKISSPRDGLEELWRNLEAEGVSPSKALRRKQRYKRLQAALASLSPDHRQVIVLARLDELPMKDVARRMDRSSKAASLLLWRALQKLKMAFGGDSDSCSLLPPREEKAPGER